ncbi:MAG: isoprenylcysteine carboxylmethyltransferase family protein [Sulfitobacter sp.]
MPRWTDTGQMTARQAVDIPPVWLLGALVLVWLVKSNLPGLVVPSSPARILGAVIAAAGVALMLWAIASFRHHQTSVVPHQTPQRLITTGPFARSRNPIYLGDILVLCGAVLWWGAWAALVLIPLFGVILQRRFIAPEEARMKQSFGAEFDAYAEKTPRWL